jgi:TatD DNase family protein
MESGLRLFDTHCHLDIELFDADRDAVLERAHAAGVTRFLNPAYDLESSRRAAALAASREGAFAAVGVHPNDAADFDETRLHQLRELTGLPKVAAIGEIGLDDYWKTVPPDAQKRAFIAQLRLADELDLPVIIHCREAFDDLMAILDDEVADEDAPRIVLHSFSGDVSHAQRAMERGYYMGIGGPVTYPKAQGLREIARSAPLDRLVIETDSPYLTPQRHRGKRNEPAYVRLVAEKIADVREMLLDDIARITTENANQLFRLQTAQDD